MTTALTKSHALAIGLLLASGTTAAAALPSVKDALSVQPVQKDVEIDRPEEAEIAGCTIKVEGKLGLVVRDAAGQILRTFSDTTGDNVVDQWSYFKDGVEVYRDVDSNANKKADQCRWINTGGSRWGIDSNEDGRIDYWKSISPEEVTAELVAAVRDHDRARFERIMLGERDLKALGVGPDKAQLLHKKAAVALANFVKMAGSQTVVARNTKWISFGGTKPCVVPAGTDGSTADVTVYENVMAMVETEGKPQPLTVGTLVRVGDTWRLIDLPSMSENAAEPFFLTMPRPLRGAAGNSVVGKPSEQVQKIMEELQAMGDLLTNNTPEQHEKRAEKLKQLAEVDVPENRSQWYRQLADTLNAAVQTGGYEAGIEKLKQLYETLEAEKKDDDLTAYVQYRWMTAQHGHDIAHVGGKDG
ncbi:MAG TPA: thioredoxin, partial [Pirellulales bacterium]|nr:thioredoxin [Pirellulales bacterium]